MPNKIDPRTEKKPMSMSGGTTIDTQYPLYVEDVYPQVMQMDGHSFVQTNVAETAPPEVPLPIVVDGKIIMSSIMSTRKYISRVEYQIGIPAWQYSVLEEIVAAGASPDIIRIRAECDECNEEAYIYTPTNPPSELKETDNLTSGGLDGSENLIGKTTDFAVVLPQRMMGMTYAVVRDDIAQALYAVGWIEGTACSLADFCPDDIIAAGAASLLELVATVATKWDDETVIAGVTPAHFITDIAVRKGVVAVTFANDLDPALAITGGIAYYRDGAVAIALVDGIANTDPWYAVDWVDKRWVAVGQAGAIAVTDTNNMEDWTSVVQTVTAGHLMDIAGDTSNGIFYIVESAGGAFTLKGSIMTDITALVDPGTLLTTLHSVAVVYPDHVLYGGDTGYVMENTAASVGGVFTATTLGANNIESITGDRWRQWFGHGAELFERSVLTMSEDRLAYEQVDFLGSQAPTGDIMALDYVRRFNGPNFLVGVTDDNELIFGYICLSTCGDD